MIASHLTKIFSKIPGFGPRSARRAVLHLLSNPNLLDELIESLATTKSKISICKDCGNIDEINPCNICQNPTRNHKCMCLVSNINDLWAIERSGTFNGIYHVLGGIISPLQGITSAQLNIDSMMTRIKGTSLDTSVSHLNTASNPRVKIEEVIIAVCATLDGQTTAYYLSDLISNLGIRVTRLAFGIPIGAELDYMDEGTLAIALNSRSTM